MDTAGARKCHHRGQTLGAPVTTATIPRVGTLEEAYAWCRALATSHYENFPVASWLVPPSIRKGLVAVYAIARIGDDIADEGWQPNGEVHGATVGDASSHTQHKRLNALAQLDRVVDGVESPDGHPAFMAIQDTIHRHSLPPEPFHRLFEAFRRDAREQVHMQSWDDVLDYCHHSANPVGELMLRLSGDWSTKAEPLSNAICTALQITNFLQDLSVDVPRRRYYIPDMPLEPAAEPTKARAALAAARTFTEKLFQRGKPVVHIPKSWMLRLELRAIIAGGMAMLKRCDDRVFLTRPTL